MYLDPAPMLWVEAYIELVQRSCPAVLLVAYAVYRLWCMKPDVIALSRKISVGMSVSLGSRTIVLESFEFV